MNRDDRQKLSVKRWIDSGGHGTIQATTGFGKTHVAIILIQAMYKRNPNLVVLIGVPTDVLKEQWTRELAKNQLFSVCKVEIFNTIVKNEYLVDLLILDEVHGCASPGNLYIFDCVKYKYILGLTATWERLDHAEQRLEQYCPVCDQINLEDALKNNWVSCYRKYQVLIDVDMTQYWEYNSKFQQLFAFFNHDFKLVMELVRNPNKAKVWAKKNGKLEGAVRGYCAQFMKYLRARKSFVMSHPKKFEIANKILDARPNNKCILFTASVKDAELFKKRGLICHSQRKKKENKAVIEEFNQMSNGLIVSPMALRTGVDIKGLSLGISCSCNSSQLLSYQELGRVIRLEDGKVAEFFTLVIRGSIEQTWYNNANRNQSYITIDENQLDIVLNNGELSTRPKKGPVDLEYRF